MAPRRVLILIGQLARGGAERQVHELARRLPRDRFVPTVATFEAGGHYQPLLEAAGVEVAVIAKDGWREAMAPARLAALMRSRGIDLVHAFLFPANWRAVLSGKLAGGRPTLCAVRSTGVWMNSRHRMMDRMALRRADAVVANAPAVRDDLIARAGVDPGRVRVILNGVDSDLFHPAGLGRDAVEVSGGHPAIGFVGSLREAKDPRLFMGIARLVAERLPAARFTIVGDGPLRGALERLASEGALAGRVRFLGERNDIPDLMRGLDVLAVTSLREGCCNAILEAMASGVAVAATAVGGNPDLVRPGVDGLLFPHGDAAGGADAVLALLTDGARASVLRASALARARERFSVEAMVRETSALYEELS